MCRLAIDFFKLKNNKIIINNFMLFLGKNHLISELQYQIGPQFCTSATEPCLLWSEENILLNVKSENATKFLSSQIVILTSQFRSLKNLVDQYIASGCKGVCFYERALGMCLNKHCYPQSSLKNFNFQTLAIIALSNWLGIWAFAKMTLLMP